MWCSSIVMRGRGCHRGKEGIHTPRPALGTDAVLLSPKPTREGYTSSSPLVQRRRRCYSRRRPRPFCSPWIASTTWVPVVARSRCLWLVARGITGGARRWGCGITHG